MLRLRGAYGLLACTACGGLVEWDGAAPSLTGGSPPIAWGGRSDTLADGGRASVGGALSGGRPAGGGASPLGGITSSGGNQTSSAGSGGDAFSGGNNASGGNTSGSSTSGSLSKGGTSSGGAATSALSIGGASGGSPSGGGVPSGGVSSSGGVNSSGGTVSAGTAGRVDASGGTSASYLQAYHDGSTLDVRLARELVNGSDAGLQYFTFVTAASESLPLKWTRHFIFDGDPARLIIGFDGASYATLNPCTSIAEDVDTVRILVPTEYLAAPPHTVASTAGPCSPACVASAEQVPVLPSFGGQPFDCTQGWEFNRSHRQYTQLLSVVGVATPRGCALGTDGEIRCWSQPGSTDVYEPPKGPFTRIGLSPPAQLCGLRPSGELVCSLLPGDSSGLDEPAAPEGGFVRIAEYGNCGILANGQVTCWATSPDTADRVIDGDFVSVSGTHHRGCAVATSGHLQCWQEIDETLPIEPALDFGLLDGRYKDVALGAGVACALTVDNQVDCVLESLALPAKVRLAGGPFRWIGGPWPVCALDEQGMATCIGRVGAVPPLPLMAVALGEWTDPPCGLDLQGYLVCWDAEGYQLP